jgi:hypothetical protein
MTDLPIPASPGTNPVIQTSDLPQVQPVVSSGNKESVGGSIDHAESLQDATGAEFELPKEVSSVGVRIQPTTVAIPQPVAQMGVKPAGQNIPVQTKPAVTLPLNDDQIAAGLHAGITESIRWLATWCVFRLKHMHIALKNIHGKLTRVNGV